MSAGAVGATTSADATVATLDDVLQALRSLETKVTSRIDRLEERVTAGLADVRALVGGVHETALRAELRIQRGHAFAEVFLVTNALGLVRLAAPAGQLLPTEDGLPFVNLSDRTADVSFLELDSKIHICVTD